LTAAYIGKLDGSDRKLQEILVIPIDSQPQNMTNLTLPSVLQFTIYLL